MQQALELAARARGRTSPNPMVGAVLVNGGRVVGEGYHHRAGEPHAEIHALRQAGGRARGATLFVTLEPCSHFGRTPPCATAVAEAGVAEVYAAMEDPNPVVAGSGLRYLEEHGIRVHVGLLEDAARRMNEAFVKRVTSGLPFVELKVATTLDGRIATGSGRSRWITGEPAREWVHRRRDAADAILVGANTVRLDNPQLTVRLPDHDGRQPLRCVVTSGGGLPPDALLFTDGAAPTAVFYPAGRRAPNVGGPDVELIAIPAAPTPAAGDDAAVAGHEHSGIGAGVDLCAMLRWLAARGVNDLLVEGGGQLNAALLRAGLVDRLSLFLAPKLFGGGPAGFAGLGVDDPDGAIRLEELQVSQVGADWLIRGRPCHPTNERA